MNIVVQKYGGSSVADTDKIKNIASRLIDLKKNNISPIVIVSAMGNTTNSLLDLASNISPNPSIREMDMLLSTGEQVTVSLLSMALNDMGHKAVSLTGFQAGIRTDGLHMKNKIRDIDISNISNYISQDYIIIVAGFQGINDLGDITTLGRGGSDTTAVAIAAKLSCSCEIYTDVDGLYSIDPRVYPKARKLDYASYEEVMEMADLGAKVIEPRSVEIASKYGVPMYIGLSTGPKNGTVIKECDNMEQNIVTGLSIIDDVIMVSLNNVYNDDNSISNIFTSLASSDINIDMISQTFSGGNLSNVSFTASKGDESMIDKVISSLKKTDIFPDSFEYNKNKDVIKLSVIGTGMRHQSGVASSIFKLFFNNSILFYQVATSEISISYIINSYDQDCAIEILADSLNL